ncbi:MAG: UvrD-helicase domain-containing protein [Parachlamydiales bacterium]
MKRFDVLDPKRDVSGSYLLEASAGTGKTFTIEHLFIRLLLAGKGVGEILVVTFTKAATRELRVRIREALVKAIADPLPYMTESAPLHRALAAFDEAKISTLHGFCHEMLTAFPVEADLTPLQGEEVSQEERLQVVKGYFRTCLEGRFSEGQLGRVLRWAGGEADQLAREVLRAAERSGQIVAARPFEVLAKEVERVWVPLPSAERLCEIGKGYKGLADRSGNLKPEVVASFEAFAKSSSADFDRWVAEGNPFLEKVVRGELKAKGMRGELEKALEPVAALYEEAASPLQILAQMAVGARERLALRLPKESRLTFDGMVEAMEKATRKTEFCGAVSRRFTTAIVDEFQDTDPLQWTILQRLFGHQQLILVGDPKQSIYAFRNADIYAYLAALEALGEEARFGLGTNYRSRPGLVKGLNTLFAPETVTDPIPLPERGKGIECPAVEAGVKEDNALSREGAVQFFAAKGVGELIPFIGQEITTLVEEHGLPYSHFAVLVSDRYQGKRVAAHLAEWGIPTRSVRGVAPAEYPLFWPLYHVVAAALDPGDGLKGRTALASPLIGLAPSQWDGEAFANLHALSHVLKERGFYPFYEALLRCKWQGHTTEERLVSRGERLNLLHELAAWVADAEPPDLLAFFHKLEAGVDERWVLRDLDASDAVHVLTIFASKGLEFGVVFALGLASRSGGGRGLVPFRRDGQTFWSGDGGSAEERQRRLDEEEAEKMRLFYVAVTRAKDRVYIPVAEEKGSPVQLYLDKANVKPLYIEVPEIVPAKREKPAEEGVERPRLTMPRVELELVQSFTGLAQGEGEPVAIETLSGEFQELPAGAETGLVLHELLEKVPPREAALPHVRRVTRGRLAGWEETLARIVEGAFGGDLGGFCLRDVRHRMVEGDFLYPVSNGMVGGIIDLFFVHEGKSYLLDWKSNRLPDYREETLWEEMARHDYGLQAKLYAEGVRRYLQLIGGPPLAGFYYLFLRGFAGGAGGKLFLTPEELEWK